MSSFTIRKLLQKEMNRKEFLAFSGAFVAAIFGITGLIKELESHAATPTASIEPETGTLTSGATALTDTTASDGKAIQFGTATAGGFTRPTGPNYETYESLYHGGDTLPQTMARRTPGKILTMPAGVFQFSDFTFLPGGKSYHYALEIGAGIVGSGPGAAGTDDGTIFEMIPGSSTRASEVPPQVPPPNGVGANLGNTNQLYLMHGVVTGGIQPIVKQLHLRGTDQGHNYNGIVLSGTTNCEISDVLITGIPGDNDGPPGETFGLNNFSSAGLQATRVEISGIRGSDGVKVGASGFGNNSSTGAVFTNCFCHDNWTGMFAMWQCSDMTTYNLKSWNNGSAGTGHSAHCINHERCANITHINPNLQSNHDATGNTGYHISWNSDQSTYDGYLRVVNPTFNSDSRKPNNLLVWSNPNYAGVKNIYGKTYNDQVSVYTSSTDNGASGVPLTNWYYSAA